MFAGWDRRRLGLGLMLGLLGVGDVLVLDLKLIPSHLETAAPMPAAASPAPIPVFASQAPPHAVAPSSSGNEGDSPPEPSRFSTTPPAPDPVDDEPRPLAEQRPVPAPTRTSVRPVAALDSREPHVAAAVSSPAQPVTNTVKQWQRGRRRSVRLLCRLHFSTGSSNIEPEAEAILRASAPRGRLEASQRLLVVGHTDPRGAEPYNVRLGHERATAVVHQLLALGHPASQIEPPVSRGSQHPLSDTNDVQAWTLNRRVEVFIVE